MHSTMTRWGRCVGTLVLALAAVIGPLATDSAAANILVPGTSILAPSQVVSTGRIVFYSATWTNDNPSTLANPNVEITLPAGSSPVPGSFDPPACTVSSGPTSPVVSCAEANLAANARLTQRLLVQLPTVTASTPAKITAVMTAKEGGNDQNKSHPDTFPADPQMFTIGTGNEDEAGGCLRDGDTSPLATRPGLSAANPLITTAGLAGPSGQVCAPVTVQEMAAQSPTEACGVGATCSTDIAKTDYVQLAPRATSPIQLTFTVVASNKNIIWYKDGQRVAECPGATGLAEGVGACVNSRSKLGSTSVRLGVLWLAGADPTWRG